MSMETFSMRSRDLDCAPCICHCRSKMDALLMQLFTPRCCRRPEMKCLAYPSQDSSKYEWEKEKNLYQCTLTDVEDGSMITQCVTRKQHNWYQFLSVSHTYTSKSLQWSSIRMVAQNLMQLLLSFNNVGKDQQMCKFNKQTNSKMWYTETHTQIDKWGRATKE